MTAGIYRIVNSQSGDFYIGSSGDIAARFKAHKYNLRRGKHHSVWLQSAWNALGDSAFVFEVIEEYSDLTTLRNREQTYIDRLHPAYNYPERIKGGRPPTAPKGYDGTLRKPGRQAGYELVYLADWRRARNMESHQLASATGLPLSTLSRLEHQKQRASLGMVALLADALRLTRSQLLNESPYRDVDSPSG